MTPDRPQKLLFVHTPKSAGVHTRGYLVDELGYDIFESVKRDQNKVWEDWTIDEIRSRIDTPSGLLMTHTLAHGWSPLAYSIPETTEQEVTEAIDVFKKAGWFTFTFIRHPGEQLCSFYHYVEAFIHRGRQDLVDKHCPITDLSIDAFVSKYIDLPLLPKHWGQFDFIDIASDEGFTRFFERHFSHEFQPGVAERHASANKGYQHYCETGVISKETQEQVSRSENMKVFQQVEDHIRSEGK